MGASTPRWRDWSWVMTLIFRLVHICSHLWMPIPTDWVVVSWTWCCTVWGVEKNKVTWEVLLICLLHNMRWCRGSDVNVYCNNQIIVKSNNVEYKYKHYIYYINGGTFFVMNVRISSIQLNIILQHDIVITNGIGTHM